MLGCSSCSRVGRDGELPVLSRPCIDWVKDVPFAHRGLHGPDTGPENSLAAFDAAMTAGYGIECDVRLLADGEVVVFHDADLARLTGRAGRIEDLRTPDLRELRLAGTDERPPLLRELLTRCAGRVPLYVELKGDSRPGRLEPAVAGMLDGYAGHVLAASFNPFSLARMAALRPDLPRCLISCDFDKATDMGRVKRFVYANLLHAAVARPHCLAYGWWGLPRLMPALFRRLGLPVLLWTVRAREDMVKALRHGDNIVFEGFLPPSPDAATEQEGRERVASAQE